MAEADRHDGVIRRKLAAGKAVLTEGGPGADRSWRLALARAARDQLGLALDVTSMTVERRSLAELLEMPPERSMIVVLDGPQEGLGLLVLSPDVLAGMIEVQTVGRVGSTAVAPRRPTRTDAAMVVATIDAALTGLEQALAQEADLVWTSGFRYASFLDDPRPLGLLLDDIGYRALRADVALAQGLRIGQILLALPAEGRGRPPKVSGLPVSETKDVGPAFTKALAVQVEAADCVLAGVLARFSVPLSRVLGMKVGEVLILPMAAIDRISVEGLDGQRVAVGRLGQNRGMRAVRLIPAAVAMPERTGVLPATSSPGPPQSELASEPLRHAG